MSNTSETELAKKLLGKYGGEVDDYFKIWPPKLYYFSSDKKAFLAYGVKYSVAVCLFDPIGPYPSVDKLISEFSRYCMREGLKPVFIQTTNKFAKLYKKYSYHHLLVGADAVIDINKFLKETIHNKYFRNIVNRFSKNGFSIATYKPPHSKKLISELHAVSKDWLKLPNHKEWNFLTGKFEEDYLSDLPIYVLKRGKTESLAFVTGLPSYRQDTVTIDLIRRSRSSPPNSIDYLLIGVIRSIHSNDGIKFFNIGMSPIDGAYFAKTTSEQLLILLYRSSQRLIGFRGLHQFKSKFKPDWEPRYVHFKGSLPGLIKVGLAIYKLMT